MNIPVFYKSYTHVVHISNNKKHYANTSYLTVSDGS